MPIDYRKGYKYQLACDYETLTDIKQIFTIRTEFIDLNEAGRLTIRSGYAWDGPSGPAIDTANTMRGSLVHDALYQLMRRDLLGRSYRHAVDKEFHRICREDGMSAFRAWYFLLGVDTFAAGAASADARKKIITAP